MQAIHTYYLPPTNHRGGRIVAKCSARRLVLGWDHEHDENANHERAANELRRTLGGSWLSMDWVSGGLPDGSRVHVAVGPS